MIRPVATHEAETEGGDGGQPVRRRRPLHALLAVLLAGPAAAEEPADAPTKRRWAALAVPLAAFDSNMGLGIGAAGQLVLADLDGDRPYRLSVDAQVYKSTRGWDDHFVGWDLPGAFGSPLRWDARVRYQRWTQAPYYGIGNDAARPDPDAVSPRWNLWESERPFFSTHVRLPVGPSSPWELYVGGLLSWLRADAFPRSQLAADAPEGLDGGFVSTLTVGLFRDTRTDEIDPTDGTVLDAAARVALPAPLSDYAYGGLHLSGRGFWSPTPGVVLAGHLVADGNAGHTPFFEQALFGGMYRTGIGGRYLLRGLGEERLRGDAVLGGQSEVRVRLFEVSILGRLDAAFAAAPFADVGQILMWDAPNRIAPHLTGGGGVRVTLNRLLVLRLDVGLAAERYEAEPTRRPQAQIYMLAAQPF